jgi:hypothetical protein
MSHDVRGWSDVPFEGNRRKYEPWTLTLYYGYAPVVTKQDNAQIRCVLEIKRAHRFSSGPSPFDAASPEETIWWMASRERKRSTSARTVAASAPNS